MPATGCPAIPSTTSRSNHQRFAGLRPPLPSMSSCAAMVEASSGCSIESHISFSASTVSSRFHGQVFMQRPQADPFMLVTRYLVHFSTSAFQIS